jgi:hypothetical protein
LLAGSGVAVVEHPATAEAPLPASLRLLKQTTYGDTALSFAVMRGDGEAVPARLPDTSQRPCAASAARRRKPRPA